MKNFKFSDAKIRDLPLLETGRAEYRDLDIPKLACRVGAKFKSFVVITIVNKKMTRVTLGRFPELNVRDARKLAQARLGVIASGVNPTAEKKKDMTLSEVLAHYLKGRQLKPVTVEGYKYHMQKNLWHDKVANEITPDMVLKKQKELTEAGATLANVVMRVLRLTLKYGKAIGATDSVATDILSEARVWHKSKRKERVIPSDKLGIWYDAVLSLQNDAAKVYLLMLLHMGLRSTETLTLEWKNLTPSTLKAIDTKNGKDLTLPIPDVLKPHLRRLKRKTKDTGLVFGGMTRPKKPMAQVTRLTGIEFSPHDCRRVFATIAEAAGIPLSTIKKLMNHSTSNDVTLGYIQTEEETLKQAVEKVSEFIANLRCNQ